MASSSVSAPYGWRRDTKPDIEEVRKTTGSRSLEPYEENVDERRVVSAYCCTCETHETLLLEAGRRRPWEHDETHPSHVVEYWRVDE